MSNRLAFLLGLALGLLLPAAFGALFIATLLTGNNAFVETLCALFRSMDTSVKITFVALVPDFFGVFMLNHFEKWQMCRGMFVAIMLYIIVLLIITL